MSTFNVSTSPVQIGQAVLPPSLIVNQGGATVYLDSRSTVSSLNYSLSLAPKQSVNWKGGEIWARCAPGTGPATLSLMTGGDTTVTPINDVTINAPVQIAGTVPVSGNVAITGPVDINGTVPVSGSVSIAGGVTVSGNMNIATMNAPVTAQIAGDIKLAGAPPIDKLTLLNTGSTASLGSTLLNNVNVTDYNSIWVCALTNQAAGVALLQYYTDTGVSSPGTYSTMSQVYGLSPTVMGFPVNGTRANLSQTGPSARTLTYAIYGSTKVLHDPTYTTTLNTGPNTGSIAGIAPVSGGIGDVYLLTGLGLSLDAVGITHNSGLHRLQITDLSSQASNALFRMRDIQTGTTLTSPLIINGATYGSMDVMIPRRACQVSFDLVAGQSSFTLSLLPL